MTNFRLFKTKEFADDNFKFDKNGRKLSKQVGNTVGKGEIARYEQFLLFPQCFQKAFSQGRQKVSLCGNGLTLYHNKILDLTKLKAVADNKLNVTEIMISLHENIVEKEENAG